MVLLAATGCPSCGAWGTKFKPEFVAGAQNLGRELMRAKRNELYGDPDKRSPIGCWVIGGISGPIHEIYGRKPSRLARWLRRTLCGDVWLDAA